MNLNLISSLTHSLICAKADVDFDTSLEKREHVEKLEKALLEFLK